MALLRVDRDTAADSALPPAAPGSVAEELELRPLHHIRELLDVAQEQLDAQDDELDDLGEQLGTPAQGTSGDPEATRIVWGQVIDAAADADEDVPDCSLDNSQKPVTSIDGAKTAVEIGPVPHSPALAGSVTGGQMVPSRELVVDLDAVSTPDALSSVLSRLLRRTGVRSLGQLTAALPADMKDEVFRAAVGRWIDGDDLPDSWPHLEALVRLMGATDDEVTAFRQAYERIIDSRSAAWAGPGGDLADLTPFTRGLHHVLRTSHTAQARTRDWIVTGFAPAVIIALTTAYTAALQAPHGPGLAKLLGYGTVLLFACLVALVVSARLTVLCARPEAAPAAQTLLHAQPDRQRDCPAGRSGTAVAHQIRHPRTVVGAPDGAAVEARRARSAGCGRRVWRVRGWVGRFRRWRRPSRAWRGFRGHRRLGRGRGCRSDRCAGGRR